MDNNVFEDCFNVLINQSRRDILLVSAPNFAFRKHSSSTYAFGSVRRGATYNN